MKILAYLALGLAGLALALGGLGAVAEQTYPAIVPVRTAVSVGATEGDPTLLILCVVGAVIVLAATIKGGR